MTKTIVELAKIKLRDGADEALLLAASADFQSAFLAGQVGFLRRELLRTGPGEYMDIVHWRSRQEADAVMEKAMTSPACATYFSVMAMDEANPGDGVSHHESLAVYE